MVVPRSPYELALGESFGGLHPRLRTYFSAIPDGRIGCGTGVFRVVGTPRRWLWPFLVILGRQGVLFPGWHADVAFTVLNEPVGSGDRVAVNARRTFEFPSGARDMLDSISFGSRGLVDHLGSKRRYVATLKLQIKDGALLLRSTRMAIRFGRRYLAVPRWIAPRVTLTEQFDEAIDRQRVTVRVAAPFVGQLYVYAGTFEYAVHTIDTGERSA